MKQRPLLFSHEIGLSTVLIVLAVLLLDPFMYWMPSDLTYVVIVLLAVLFAIFSGLLWKEQPTDEREAAHATQASRVGYIIGTTSILIGIIAQAFAGAVSVWLVLALAGMIIGKLVTLTWRHKNY